MYNSIFKRIQQLVTANLGWLVLFNFGLRFLVDLFDVWPHLRLECEEIHAIVVFQIFLEREIYLSQTLENHNHLLNPSLET